MSTGQLQRYLISYARGPRYQIEREVRRLERRGEVQAYWDLRREQRGLVSIPYVRIRTAGQATRRQLLRWTVAMLPGLAVLGWLMWRMRHQFVMGLICLALAGAGALLFGRRGASHWKQGCSGLHCEGCGGR